MNSTGFEVVSQFESEIADYAGSKYAVAVDSCCNALFLCAKRIGIKKAILPKFTYPGVACAFINAGCKVEFKNTKWSGAYNIPPSNIYDSALRFKRGMYVKDSLYCLSFHYKKHLPIGRGGMILTNSIDHWWWFRRARFDGRDQLPLREQQDIKVSGYNMYLTPEQAARGLVLLNLMKDKELQDIDSTKQDYPDISKFTAFKNV